MALSFITNGDYIDFINTDDTSLQVETLIKRLHNTSKAITWLLPEDTSIINFVIDGVRYEQTPITSIDFDGVAMTVQADFKTGIEAMFPGLAGGGSSYLVYTALFTQASTSNPVVTELQNTLGGAVVWTRTGLGQYDGTLTGAFPQLKTVVPNFINFDGVGTTYIPISDGSLTPSAILGYYTIYRGSNNIIAITVVDATHNSADWSTVVGTSILTIDIKVYP